MNLKKNKCPVCGKKMKDINGTLQCSECGYRIIGNSSTSSVNITNTNTQTANPYEPRFSYNEDHAAPASSSTQNKNTSRKKIEWVIVTVAITVGIASRLFSFIHLMDNNDSTTPTIPVLQEPSTKVTYPTENKPDSSSKKTSYQLPESEMFQQFISIIFNTDYFKVTEGQIAQINSIHIHYNDSGYRTISYTLKDGTKGNLYFNDSRITTSDLNCFTGLECLKLEGCELEKGDLTKLHSLTELWCSNSPSEIKQMISPKQLTSLGIDSSIFTNSLNGIEAFSNLSYLYLDGGDYYLKDISAISSLEKLKSLEITNGNSIENFKVLYNMPNLETLLVDSKNLRDISFISKMPALQHLSIINSEVLNIDALADCKDHLLLLNLSTNYQIKDYSVVSELYNLVDLTLDIDYLFENSLPLPDLGNMPWLTRLSISHYDELSPLSYATGLTELTMSKIYANDYSALANLTNLKQLNLIDMSCDPSTLEPINNLTQLETINLSNSYIWGNVEGLLKLPNLKALNLNECTAGFDMENLAENQSLEILHMNNVILKALNNGKWDYNANNENNIHLSDYADMFHYYPNIKELYLAGNQLDNIDFTWNMGELRVLDITDNYVTSLMPLAILPRFDVIMCASNPIAEDSGLKCRILTDN